MTRNTMLYTSHPVNRDTTCTLCSLHVSKGYGASLYCGTGRLLPFHKTCASALLQVMRQGGELTFKKGIEKDYRMTIVLYDIDEIKRKGVEGMNGGHIKRIICDGSEKMDVLQALIRGVTPAHLEEYLGHKLLRTTPNRVRKSRRVSGTKSKVISVEAIVI